MRALPLVALALLAACDCNKTDETAATTTPETPAAEPVQPIEPVEVSMDKVFLGRRLFHDPILSGDGTVSCATCHSLDHGGAEDRATSLGIREQVGPINSPTVLNAHYNFVQFWDGRATDLQDQAGGPVENPLEMGTTFTDVIPRIQADEWYAERFAAVYGSDDPITKENITDAIAEYERYLITPSPFDRYLRGETDAISEQARRGYQTFKDVGCPTCHLGMNLGGTMFQKMGLVENYFELRGGEITEADLGRFNVTGRDADRHFFKVPTLRNVAITGPWYHDGSQTDLGESVRLMGRLQLGQRLSDEQVADIVAFLVTLTGELPEHARLPDEEAPPSRAIPGAEGDAEPAAHGTTEAEG
ncbi:MAG: cytochrome-c peroxidase [Myxococcales bacterium]|nr:cytochrome-c peroxidase [Myxococcales bacterium]